MPWLPKAVPILVAIVALNLAMVFGFEAVRIFTSPIYGLEVHPFASQIHGIGRLLGVQGPGLFSVAAFFGAIYLTVAAVFALHLANRIGALRGARISHDLLDAGMILVVIATVPAAMPAMMQGASDVLIHGRLPLWMVGLAATLSMIERLPEEGASRPGLVERTWSRFAGRHGGNRAMTVSPAIGERVAPQRWMALRHEAGMAMQTARDGRPAGAWTHAAPVPGPRHRSS